MPHGTEHHLEHAEHAQHHAHDPFDRRVAMTIAIVAASLACVTMLSHRAHNDTLRYQTEATKLAVNASNQWAYFQAKKLRQYNYEALAAHLAVVPKDPNNSSAKEEADKTIAKWLADAARYKKETTEIEEEARRLEGETKKALDASQHIHHVGDRYDLGELGIEMALILCSIAVLTKQKGFWFGGIAVGLVGIAVVGVGLYGQFMPH